MVSKYLIVADDFTGANDTGVQLKRKGKPTYVTFQKDIIAPQNGSLVIDTESRNCSGQQAFTLINEALFRVDLDSYDVVIKKIDSTLRGNIAEEIKALDALYGSGLVLVLSALPDLGRVTLQGRQYLNGLPILETEHAHDPIKPVKEDNLVSLLSKVYDEPVASVTIEEIRTGSFDLSRSRIVVCDSETNEDMLIALKKAASLQTKVLYVGTAALADHLCELENPAKPSLAIIASLNSVSAEQVRFAQKAGVSSVILPIAELLAKEEYMGTYIEKALQLLNEGKDLLIVSSGVLDPDSYQTSLNKGALQGLSKEEVSRQTRTLISEIGKALVDKVPLSGVVVTGGDTAMGLMEALSVEMTEILAEIAIGIPLMRLVGGPHHGMKVVTKAGGFGKSDALFFSLRYLKASN